MQFERPQVSELTLAFGMPDGIATATRVLSGKILDGPPDEFVKLILRGMAIGVGGPLLDHVVTSIGFALVGIPEAFIGVLTEHLPSNTNVARTLARKWDWRGDIPAGAFEMRGGERHG